MKMKATTGILSAMLVVGTTFSVVQMKELSEQQTAFRKLNASSQLVLQTNKELEEKLNALKATNEQLKKDLSDLHRLRNEATQAQHLAARIAKLEKENQRFNNLADASEVNAGEFQEQLLIDPDRGLGPIAFGMPMEDVKAQLGDPDIITGSVLHYQSRGFAILPNGKDNTVGAIMMGDTEGGILTQLFKGQTQKGIIMGASREEVIDAYGPPVTKQPREQQKMDPEVLRRFFGDQAPPPEALDVEAMEAARGYERLNYQEGNLTFLLKDGKLVHITVRQARSSF